MDYKKLQSAASKLIKSFGSNQLATIQYMNGKSGTAKTYAVIVDSVDRDRTGTIHNQSKVAYLNGTLKIMPEAGDVLIVGKKTFTVRTAEDITPNGSITCAYRLEVS